MPQIKVQVRNATTGLREEKLTALYLANKMSAAVSGGNNSTADVDMLTLNIPANTLVAGDTFNFELRGRITKALGTSNPSYYLKVGATKNTMIVYAPGILAFTNRPYVFRGTITFRTVGVTAAWVVMADASFNNTATHQLSNLFSGTIDSTANISLVLGAFFSAAINGNLLEGQIGGIDSI